ncbi:MAG TPA: 2-dehydropantoate 2-reductase [Aliidongia sp.]|nr:2-dehydropantoate 2-reductase [Aliidongia sp.]
MTAGRPILIWGAGAIGGVVGAYLIRAGHDIVFVDQDAEHVAAINNQGLEIEGPIDAFTVKAKALLPGQVQGEFDHIYLCVKAHHTEAATLALAPHLAADGYVLSLQNGLNELVIGNIIGRDRTIGAFVNFGADYLGPGLITFGGRGAFVLGELHGATTPRLKALAELIRGSFEPGAEITGNIWGYLWGKLGYGALLFATALTNASIVDVLGSARHRDLLGALGQEVTEVTVAKGIRPEGFNGFDPDAFRAGADRAARDASFDVMVAHNRKSAKSHSGVWRDLAIRKRKTEADAQFGPIVEAARELGMEVPITEALIALIHEIEDGSRPLDWSNLDALADRGKFQS